MKYLNYIILFILLSLAFVFKDSLTLSTNLLSLFAHKASVKNLSIATELGYTRELLIGVKGFDKVSKEKIELLVEEFRELKAIKSIQYSLNPSKDIQNYYKQNYLILSDFDSTIQDSGEIQRKLRALKKEQLGSFFYTPIDKNDPLKLFSLKEGNTKTKGKYIELGDFGYLLKLHTNVSPSQMGEAEILYKEIKSITDKYTDVMAFSGFFYTVENSKKIKEEVVYIALFSVIILLLIYSVILKNIRILFHTVLALFSSTLFASLVTLFFFDDFHVISLVFGMSITAVSIDYLFHYYFHDFYLSNKRIEKNVLYGFLTTLSAFVIFSFIPVILIAQISFFTVLSLSFSYILFTFVFKRLKFSPYIEGSLDVRKYYVFSSYFILFISFVLIIYSSFTIKLDNNIRSLDYQNEKLLSIEKTFKDAGDKKLSPILVSAKTKEQLFRNLHTLKENQKETFSLASFVLDAASCDTKKEILENYDFKVLNTQLNKEASALGFKNGYFKDAYKITENLPSCALNNLNIFESYDLRIVKKEGIFYTLAYVSKSDKAELYDFVHSVNIKNMFTKVSKKMYLDIALYGLIVLLLIFLLLYLSVKEKFFYALTYILFPFSIALSIVVSLYSVNVMHIFGFIVLIAIGIDYGIYMSNTNKPKQTMLAIKYSLLSTFAAFGVLVFSSITALYSVGLVISLGVASIFFLIKSMK